MEFALLIKKLNGSLTKEEAIVFDSWYNESVLHQEYFKKLKINYENNKDLNTDTDQAFVVVQNKLKLKEKKKWYFPAAAVMIGIILLSTFVQFYKNNEDKVPFDDPISEKVTDIPYGTNKALLKKDDGSNISLHKGKNYEDNLVISNGETLNYKKETKNLPNTTYNILEVPRGGVFTVTLEDGTVIWLNSASSIKYPVSFTNLASREVQLLYGEAYFDVTPSSENQGKIFKVVSNNQSIQVLGTEFNIKAYQEENEVATTLVEGKISLTTPNKKRELSPGKKAIFNKTTEDIEVKDINIYDEISWKDGLFSFKNKSLNEILNVLSRWYDVEIKIENKKAANTNFNGVLNKRQNLDQILLIIEKTNEAKFVTIGNTIILK